MEINQNKKNIDTWRLPLSMVLFLDTAFKTNTLVRVIPWLSLRKVIFSIYNERMKSSECMENSIYCGNVTMEEFVSYYFLKVSIFNQKNDKFRLEKNHIFWHKFSTKCIIHALTPLRSPKSEELQKIRCWSSSHP